MQAFGSDRYYASQPPPGPYIAQSPYAQQFAGYGYPTPGPSPPIAQPFPVYPPHYDQMLPATPHLQPGRPRPLARDTSRGSTPGRPDPKPLKSAMKRNKTPDRLTPMAGHPPRGRPESLRRKRTRSGSRMRSGSIPRPPSDHLILTIQSSSHICIENMDDESLGEELSAHIVPIWPPGANSIQNHRGKWAVEFAGTPWASSGLDAILSVFLVLASHPRADLLPALRAGKMIWHIWLALARRGFTYLSTINVGNRVQFKPPSMVFVETDKDYEAQIFLMTLSKRGDRMTIAEAPEELMEQLSAELRRTFPRRFTADRATENNIRIFEVKKGSYGTPAIDKNVLIAFILHFFNAAGFRLSGTIPIGSKSFLGIGRRKEMWVFRSLPWRPGAREDLRPESRASRSHHGHVGP
ncbi:hypothetical protein BN946_scf184911.g63 [Trametes cinnabarina]|uniref:Uncharacterized protein n=1 Tax=Pycnoporus cinnabarinus TaxID=5643 RepID=A0A060SGP2_PYCCI|nr:hypothetical protein BN946_scf184911.g63 [Trametes cinnabarina]